MSHPIYHFITKKKKKKSSYTWTFAHSCDHNLIETYGTRIRSHPQNIKQKMKKKNIKKKMIKIPNLFLLNVVLYYI